MAGELVELIPVKLSPFLLIIEQCYDDASSKLGFNALCQISIL